MHSITVQPFEIFQALSDPLRVRVLKLLAETDMETCLCEFSDCLEEPDYKVSRHLKVLRQAGLLSFEKEGRWIYYRIAQEGSYLLHLSEMLKSFPRNVEPFKGDLLRFKRQKRHLAGKRCKGDRRMPPRVTKAAKGLGSSTAAGG